MNKPASAKALGSVKPAASSVKPAAMPVSSSPNRDGGPLETNINTDLQSLIQFEVPFASKAEVIDLFEKIAEAYLNHTVIEVRPSGSAPFENDAEKYFRVAEIEFYLNDYQQHKDTFTHGDAMQKTTGNWYFHKLGKSYKAGSYKGLDLSIGKGEGIAAGGILLRSMIPLTLAPSSTADRMVFTEDSRNKSEFVQGPCNCVDRILEETKPEGSKDRFGIAELVDSADFNLDVFDSQSCFHLLCSTPE